MIDNLPGWWRVASILQLVIVAIVGSLLLLLVDALSRPPTIVDYTLNLVAPLALAAMLMAGGGMAWRRRARPIAYLLLFSPAMLLFALASYANFA